MAYYIKTLDIDTFALQETIVNDDWEIDYITIKVFKTYEDATEHAVNLVKGAKDE